MKGIVTAGVANPVLASLLAPLPTTVLCHLWCEARGCRYGGQVLVPRGKKHPADLCARVIAHSVPAATRVVGQVVPA
jgi:hypothetical protein